MCCAYGTPSTERHSCVRSVGAWIRTTTEEPGKNFISSFSSDFVPVVKKEKVTMIAQSGASKPKVMAPVCNLIKIFSNTA